MSESERSYTVRGYRPGDEHAILEVFNRCFAEVDPTFTPREMAQWRWQYEHNPAGLQVCVAEAEDGFLFSHVAGIPQRVLLKGQPTKISQAVDSLTDPRYRKGLKKPGMFVVLGLEYWARYAGQPPEREVIVWGLPVPVAWRMGQRFLDYTLIRNVNQLVWPLEDPPAGRTLDAAAAATVDVAEVREIPDEVGELFARVAEGRGLIGIRDRAYLTWRFLERPDRRYEIAVARSSGNRTPCGLAVWCEGDFALQRGGLLCEWLVDPAVPAATDALLGWARERTRAAGLERLVTVVTDTSPEWLALQRAGFLVRPTSYPLVARLFPKWLDTRWLHKHWYLTLGETDLV